MVTIFEAKEMATPQLMSIPGVVGVGISSIKNTIVVYIERATKEILLQIPREIQGYKIEILETGKFKALKW